MASSKWKTYQELEQKVKNKKVVFWGASNWIERTLNKIKLPVAYIVDKSKLNQGIKYNNLEIFSPEKLKQEKKDKIFIIISTANYASVIDELHLIGFIMGENFCCSPELNQRKNKDDILEHKQTLLISSQQHWFDHKSGGGIYKYSTNPKKIKKVYSGKCRGIAKFKNQYYVVDMLKGIVILDKNFKQIKLINIQKNSEPHGITIDQNTKKLYLSQPGRDSIAAYSLKTNKLVKEFHLSHKWKLNRKDNHHINDLCIHEQSIYVAIFSFSGNWLSEIYDGGILELDKDSGKIIGPIVSGLWMPHSVSRIQGKISYLNSMMGELYSGNKNKLTAINGFARGLDFDGKYYYIGVSEHRYPEKLQNISNNIGLNTGFYIFDPETNMTKFFPLPMAETIHSVILTI